MTCCLQSFILPMLVLLVFLSIHLQENRSGFAENNFRMMRSSDMDFDTIATSPDDTNQIDPKDKSDEDDKPKHFGYDKHSVLLTAQWARKEDTPYHWSAPSAEEYVFQQLHFHWGQDDHSGSEHTLNNERFALEMHVVHYRRDISPLELDGRYNTGIRVIGVFFRISETEHNNTGLQQIVQFLPTVRMADTTTLLPEPFSLSRLVPEFSNLYLTYNGSLTTPPCTEAVSWVIRKEPLTVSRQQVEEFRNLMGQDGQTIKHNWRPTQPLNGRIVVHIR